MIRRREFITLFGGAAAWPLAVRAQQPAMPVIGFLGTDSLDLYAIRLRAFHQGLRETGFVEGRNVAFEYRWAEGEYGRFPTLAADLVSRKVAVIAAAGGIPPALAAKSVTTTIPIILAAGRNNVPAVASGPGFTRAGGLLSYGGDQVDNFRRAATYVDRILRGEKPGDLPVQFPTKFEMVLNRKTATALGLDIPATVYALATEVIE